MTSFITMSGIAEGANFIPIAVFILIVVISTLYIGTWIIKRNKTSRKSKPNIKGPQPQQVKKKANNIHVTKKKGAQAKVPPVPEAKHNFEHPHLLSSLKGHKGQITGGEFSSNGKYFLTSADVVKDCSNVAGMKKEKSTNDFKALNNCDSSRWKCNDYISSDPPSDTEDSLTSSSSCSQKLSRRQKKNKKKKKLIANINIDSSSNTDANNNSSDKNNNSKNNTINNSNLTIKNNNKNASINLNMVNNSTKNINKIKHKSNNYKNKQKIFSQRNDKPFKSMKYYRKSDLELHSLLLPLCISIQDRILNGYPYETYIGIYVYKALGFSSIDSILGDHRLVKEEIQDLNISERLGMDSQDLPIANLKPKMTLNGVNNFSPPSGPYIKNYQKCLRCRQYFDIWVNGATPCFYHPKKAVLTSEGSLKYACCNLSKMNSGCFMSNYHVFHHLSSGVNGPLFGFISTKPIYIRAPTVFGLDCEMVYTTQGFEVARATLVNVQGELQLDIFIQPIGQILDYNTHFSGIEEHHLTKAYSFSKAQQMILQRVSSSDILVGHSLEGDLAVLKILHRRVVDTSLLFNKNSSDSSLVGSPMPYRQALKSLVKEHLGQDIQNSDSEGHNSAEDATAALNLVLHQIDAK